MINHESNLFETTQRDCFKRGYPLKQKIWWQWCYAMIFPPTTLKYDSMRMQSRSFQEAQMKMLFLMSLFQLTFMDLTPRRVRRGGGGLGFNNPPPPPLAMFFFFFFLFACHPGGRYVNDVKNCKKKKMCRSLPPPPPPAQRLFQAWRGIEEFALENTTL